MQAGAYLGSAGIVLVGAWLLGGLAGCAGSDEAAVPLELAVTGEVILPDSTALFGASIGTEPATVYVATDEAGYFWIALPRPGTYTFVATHPGARYRGLEGRLTEVPVDYGQVPHLVIMMGQTHRIPLMDVNERAAPALRRGKKRTGR